MTRLFDGLLERYSPSSASAERKPVRTWGVTAANFYRVTRNRTSVVVLSEERYRRLDPISATFKLSRRVALDRSGSGEATYRLSPRRADCLFLTVVTAARAYHRLAVSRNCSRYTNEDPFKLIAVDPSTITHASPGTDREFGSVVDGDWDRETAPLTERPQYELLEMRYIDGLPWRSDKMLQTIDRQFEEGHYAGYERDRFLISLEKFDELYANLERDGYLTQYELLERGYEVFDRNNDAMHPYFNEVVVDIGRDGQLLWRTRGQHRLFLANVLGFESIPALVWTRHGEWERTREQRVDSSEHPDLIEPYGNVPCTTRIASASRDTRRRRRHQCSVAGDAYPLSPLDHRD